MNNSGNEDSHSESGKGPFDREKHSDILHAEFGQDARVGVGTSRLDGLPTIVTESHNPAAPPLTYDHFVCMADEREFVRRDGWGEVQVSFAPEEVQRSPNGDAYVTLGQLREKVGKRINDIFFSYDTHKIIGGQKPDTDRYQVYPVRERCTLLVEMMTDCEGDPEKVIITRLCGLRHDEAGDMLSLRDSMVIACMGRTPRDFVSEDRLRKCNQRTIKAGADRVEAGGIFDIASLDAVDPLEGVFG